MSEEERGILRLDELLKKEGIVRSGGEAKHLIQGGEVTLNGVVETRRKKQLAVGDVVEVGDVMLTLTEEDFAPEEEEEL